MVYGVGGPYQPDRMGETPSMPTPDYQSMLRAFLIHIASIMDRIDSGGQDVSYDDFAALENEIDLVYTHIGQAPNIPTQKVFDDLITLKNALWTAKVAWNLLPAGDPNRAAVAENMLRVAGQNAHAVIDLISPIHPLDISAVPDDIKKDLQAIYDKMTEMSEHPEKYQSSDIRAASNELLRLQERCENIPNFPQDELLAIRNSQVMLQSTSMLWDYPQLSSFLGQMVSFSRSPLVSWVEKP